MTRIIIIATYFGKWPVWFPAFLLSCAMNRTIEWLFFTDCGIPKVTYSNIKFERMDLEQFNNLASRKLGFRIQKGAFSQVDLQPAFGVIFDEYIKGFDFWGHCDIDVVWGDIRNFVTESILQDHQIVSCRKNYTAGHFTLWKNEPQTNLFFQSVPTYQEVFQDSECYGFDEEPISNFLKVLLASPVRNSMIRVHWPEQMVVGVHELAATPNGWYWDKGKVFDAKQREHVYIHFQDWKRSLNYIDFQVGDQPSKFKITKRGIWSRRLTFREFIFEWFR